MSELRFLKAGDKAPNFKLQNEKEELVKLSDFKGKKLVLFFYPKDNTPTCTIEACNLRDNYKALQKAGYTILGISPDSAKKHQNFMINAKGKIDEVIYSVKSKVHAEQILNVDPQ